MGLAGLASILVLIPAASAYEDSELIRRCCFHFSGLLLYLILFSVRKGPPSSSNIDAFLMKWMFLWSKRFFYLGAPLRVNGFKEYYESINILN